MRSIHTYIVIGMGLIVSPISIAAAQRLDDNALRRTNAPELTAAPAAIGRQLSASADSAPQLIPPVPRRAEPNACAGRVVASAIGGGLLGALAGDLMGSFPDGGTSKSRQNGAMLGLFLGAGVMALESARDCERTSSRTRRRY